MLQGPGRRHHDADYHNDGRKDNSAQRVIRQGVENLSPGEDVETNEEDVVGEEHKPRELISNPALSKCIVSKVT